MPHTHSEVICDLVDVHEHGQACCGDLWRRARSDAAVTFADSGSPSDGVALGGSVGPGQAARQDPTSLTRFLTEINRNRDHDPSKVFGELGFPWRSN